MKRVWAIDVLASLRFWHPLSSEIDGDMVKQFKTAWQQSGLRIKDTEAIVMIRREREGSAKAVLGPSTN
jgi:hypothetical protein